MKSSAAAGAVSGRLITAAAVLFLLFDIITKSGMTQQVVQALKELGCPDGLTASFGVLVAACIFLCAFAFHSQAHLARFRVVV